MQNSERPSDTAGAGLLVELGRDVPALRRRYSHRFAAIAGELVPFVCRWEDDALAGALEAAYASTSMIQPKLLAVRRYFFRLFSVAPSEQARSVFQESVHGSSLAADHLFDQVDLFVSTQARAMPAFRKLLLNLSLEMLEARKSSDRLAARLDAYQAYLGQRAQATASADIREALASLVEKSLRLQQEVRTVERMCAAAQQLHAACEDMLRDGDGLIALLRGRVEPAWHNLMDSATTLHGAARAVAGPDRVARVAECTAEYENWLEESMRACLTFREHCEAAQQSILSLRA